MNSIFSNNLNTQNNSGVFGGTLFNNGFSGFGSQSGTLSNGFSSSNGLFGGNYGGSFFSGFGNWVQRLRRYLRQLRQQLLGLRQRRKHLYGRNHQHAEHAERASWPFNSCESDRGHGLQFRV